MDSKLKVGVIIGSTRKGRFSEQVAQWVFAEIQKQNGIDAELLDLRDYPMPFFDEEVPPSSKEGPYANEAAAAWEKKVEEKDAFIVVTAEYNHGYPAVLKNAFDYTYKAWNKKVIGFVSYGSIAGGARAVEQLRGVAAELQMASTRTAVHIPNPWEKLDDSGKLKTADFEHPLSTLFEQISWWGNAAKAARAQ